MSSAMPPLVGTEAFAWSRTVGGVADLLDWQAQQRPSQVALVFGDSRLTYGALSSRCRAIAYQLAELGVRQGDKVALFFPNHVDYVASFFAVTGLGATVVPINSLLKSEEIAHIISDAQAKVLICYEEGLNEVYAALPYAADVKHVLVSSLDVVSEKTHVQTEHAHVISLTRSTEAPEFFPWTCRVNPATDLAVLVYTSGTTGKPKGAMLTHHNLLFTLHTALREFNITDRDCFLGVLPLCHIYGLVVVMLGIFSRGGTLVMMEKFEAKTTLKTIEQEKITFLPLVPAMYQFLLMEQEESPCNLSSVRVCLSGAAPLTGELKGRIEEVFGPSLVEGYGLTEVSSVVSVNTPNGLRKTGSVGLPIKDVTVAIISRDGEFLAPGQDNIGEIAVKGANIMLGYYQRQEATQEVFYKGWFLTGDLGYVDEEGYLFIVGRKKELIIRGGQNIYPREVEEVIARMPAVAEVAVVGVLDKFMGERVKAVVVVCPGQSLTDT
ncbi:MAG: AMP-binding protein, partial [Candidatus Melainabacteria bacterium]|nr:AMP-binding protein [Candidatus Melainabacteria bacterium]